MTYSLSEEVAQVFHSAAKEPLIPVSDRRSGPILDREAVESVLPHRHPFLFIGRVTMLNVIEGLIVAHYDLSKAQDVFSGHFPGCPIWPGVLQVEAVGQAGILLHLKGAEEGRPSDVTMTHIVGARFLRPVVPGDVVEVLARIVEDGLLYTVVGQCLQNETICSVAAVTILC